MKQSYMNRILLRVLTVFICLAIIVGIAPFAMALEEEPKETHKMILNVDYEKGELFNRPSVDVYVAGYKVGKVKSGKTQTFYIESSRSEHFITMYTASSDGALLWGKVSHLTNITVDFSFRYKDDKLECINYDVTDGLEEVDSKREFENIDDSYFFTHQGIGFNGTWSRKKGKSYSGLLFDLSNNIAVGYGYSDRGKSSFSVYQLEVVQAGRVTKYYMIDNETKAVDYSHYYQLEPDNVLWYCTEEHGTIEAERTIRIPTLPYELEKCGFLEAYPSPSTIDFEE